MEMNDTKLKSFCLELMQADSEADVIRILNGKGYWENSGYWRNYGDQENNIATFSNQSQRSEWALVEKITNSIDAILINDCLLQKVDPESSKAPQSIREAIMRFYSTDGKGYFIDWSEILKKEMQKKLTLSVTGGKPDDSFKPCISIADCGEGQTPESVCSTILSIQRGNKTKIPFVQGEYNQGGTGAMRFCGSNHLQLVVTRRNPDILPENHKPNDKLWSFTVVRREEPRENEKNFRYTYLAPVKTDSEEPNGVLSFNSESMPLLAEQNNAYGRETRSGTLIKLYEFSYQRYSHILRRDGLLYRLNLLLPEPPLPYTLHECRYKGHKGSHSNPATGIVARLEENLDRLEADFPQKLKFPVEYKNDGSTQSFTAHIYAFKKKQQGGYKTVEGILFSYNGQVHHMLEDRMFRNTRKVGLDAIAKELLIILDCSEISRTGKADLLMSSRDRAVENDFYYSVMDRLCIELKNHEGLRALRNKRQQEDTEEQVSNTKSLEKLFIKLINQDNTLASLLNLGDKSRISSPFDLEGKGDGKSPIETKKFPTYFKFKNKTYGDSLRRNVEEGRSARIEFETDADVDYFSRRNDPGNFLLCKVDDEDIVPYDRCTSPVVRNGIAKITVDLPTSAKLDDVYKFEAKVSDINGADFSNKFSLSIIKKVERNGDNRKKPKSPSNDRGNKRNAPSNLTPPMPNPIYRDSWDNHDFNENSCLKISLGNSDIEGEDKYIYYINMDNYWLLEELKNAKKRQKKGIRNQYIFGSVLIGMALIRQYKREEGKRSSEDDDIIDHVARVSSAIAPMLVPMLRNLGGNIVGRLDLDDEEE